MTLTQWADLVRTIGPRKAIERTTAAGYRFADLLCMTDRSRLSVDEKADVHEAIHDISQVQADFLN